MLDVESAVAYYFINEYTLNRESFVSSFYWYKDGPEDVLHLGPIWDFDSCMGMDGTGADESFGYNHSLFALLLAIPAFRDYALDWFAQNREAFDGLADAIPGLTETIGISAEMNELRWSIFGTVNPKSGIPYAESYYGAVSALREWLEEREKCFAVPQTLVLSTKLSEDGNILELRLADTNAGTAGVNVAVWSVENGQDDLVWYRAEKSGPGEWRVQVDLRDHGSKGHYECHAYRKGETELAAAGRAWRP
jgi:hypothetical protein